MKTIITLAASLAVMLCGCRGPHPFASRSELAGHKPDSEDTSLASAVRPAARTRESRSADNVDTDAPVAELLLKAEQAIRANQLVVARSQLQSILAQQPDQPRAHHLMAIVADQDGRYSEAEQHYFLALAQDPRNSKILGDLGYSYYLQSRFAESEQYLQQALELDPRNSRAARNLAQLYSDRDEFSRAEHLLSTTLPPMEARTALQQLRPNNARVEASPASSGNSAPTPDELQQQLRGQMYATAGTYPQSVPDQRVPDATLTQGRTPADSFKPVPRDNDPVNPWTRYDSSIDPGNQYGSAPGGVQSQTRRESGTIAATAAQRYGDVQQASDRWRPDDLPAVQPNGTSRNTMPAAGNRPVATSEPRRWPPAAWEPLADDATSTDRASSPPTYSMQSGGGIHQVSGTVNPWNADVRRAAGREEPADVRHAYYENHNSDRVGRDAIQPASLQQPNTPAVIPEWDSQPSGMRSRPSMGTETAMQRRPAGPATGLPVVIPAGSAAGTQTQGTPTGGSMRTDPSRQTYGAAANHAVQNSYARAPESAAVAPTSGVPAYPFGHSANSTSRDPRQTAGGRPAWTADDDQDAEGSGWMQGVPNTSAPMTAAPRQTSNVIEPEPYQSRQRPGTTNSTRLPDGYQYRY